MVLLMVESKPALMILDIYVSMLDSTPEFLLFCLLLLAGVWYQRLPGSDETCSYPDGVGAQHQGRGNASAVEDASSGNELHGLSCEWGLVGLADISAGGDEDAKRLVSERGGG